MLGRTGRPGRHPAGTTIAVRRVPRDDRGRPSGAPPIVFEVPEVAIEPRATVDVSRPGGGNPTGDGRETVVTTREVYLPPGAGLHIHDEVWMPGENRDARPMWRLTAQPHQARNPFSGDYPGDVITVERVDG